ncbi:MAG: hypothetical protein H6548_00375 [Chitinophagales bacterium]|nr:hypothetical protein [Chitinophagales bacterium]MCB9019301.1 hypothetical protein [Chitinophagales bacterium]MCB9020552.1 hypothetical protein [Chitinophagales bacterium]MCB9031496.1 hypothetical protein [Chitinophagales bacterium]HPE97077.1 ATP-binding protein [Chitinophagales bacterium]
MRSNTRLFHSLLLLTWLVSIFWLVRGLVFSRQLPDVEQEARKVVNSYRALEDKILQVVTDRSVANRLLTDSYTFDEFESLCRLPFGLVVLQGDSAAFWTSNAIMPVEAQFQANDAPLFITEKNGSYVLYQHTFEDSLHTIAFLPLRMDFGINNRYLSDIEVEGIHIPVYFDLSPVKQDRSLPVTSVTGEEVFFLVPDVSRMGQEGSHPLLIIPFLLFFLTTLYVLYQLRRPLLNHARVRWPVLAYLLLLVLSYAVLHFGLFSRMEGTSLFDPVIYASSWMATSLGDLLVRSLLLLLFVLALSQQTLGNRKALLITAHVMLALLVWFTVLMINSLVIDSAIAFDIRELFLLNSNTLVAAVCIATTCLATALLAAKLLPVRSGNRQWWWIFPVTVLFILLLQGLINGMPDRHFGGFSLVLLVLMGVFGFRQKRSTSLLFNLIWLLAFSMLSAWIMNDALYRKSEENKRLYAYKKSVEKDPLAEYLFSGQREEISHLLKVQLSQQPPQQVTIRQGLVNQLVQDMQSSYFKKYQTEIYFFLDDSFLVGTGQLDHPSIYDFINDIENNGSYTTSPDLYFINDYSGNFFYIAELYIPYDSGHELQVYFRLIPRRFNSESLYPELLVDDDLRLPSGQERFNYAVYYDNNLVERKGAYSYPVMDVFYLKKGEEYADKIINGYDHFIYAAGESKKVVVSEPDQDMLTAVSYFSFLFFFFLLFFGLLSGMELLERMANGEVTLKGLLDTSLKNKIQLAIVSLVVFTFLSLGIATIIYITGQFDRSNGDKLLEKIEAVQTNIDYLITDNRRNSDRILQQQVVVRRLGNRIAELSSIHDMDINLYSKNGLLINSSQPDIFEKGLISPKMNPIAFFKMTCEKETWFIHSEQIGRLTFLSAYVPILDESGEVLFYVNLPYFATEKNLQAEISSLMVALVNVYVLLLVLSALIALLVSRNITLPLSLVAGTFRSVQLGKKNEPVSWPHKDEIGLLVTEYNKMLEQLEQSARLLAQSERESAWRDMAKQVAHEIKNPLTPMRLSIQHLQRAIESGRPDVEELTSRVAKTLMEQIDNLSFIASEFSNFAVMPKAVNEPIELGRLLSNVSSLFDETERTRITLELPEAEMIIWADRNQILRVFNNLVKNGLQAIPEDREGSMIIRLSASQGRALVTVQDNGAGIPDDIKDQVFVPNFTTKSSGMGIGLALSKNIVESAGGYIWFESEPGSGTTFFVEFPLYDGRQEEGADT